MSIQDWGNFGQVVGASSGALVGLLFVAVSLNRNRIAQNTLLRASAFQTLVLFMLPLVVSILLLTPGQPHWVLGSELITVAVIDGVILVIAGRRKQTPSSGEESRLAGLLDRSSPNLLTTLLILVAGVTLTAGHGGGLYWLVPAVVFALVGGAVGAWFFPRPRARLTSVRRRSRSVGRASYPSHFGGAALGTCPISANLSPPAPRSPSSRGLWDAARQLAGWLRTWPSLPELLVCGDSSLTSTAHHREPIGGSASFGRATYGHRLGQFMRVEPSARLRASRSRIS